MHHRNYLRSTIIQGAAGTASITRIQEELRNNPPLEVAGLKVATVNDYWDSGQYGEFKSETDRSARNFLTFHFEDGLKASIRPSGTEPKNKVYIEKPSDPLGPNVSDDEFFALRNRIDHEVEEFSIAFMKHMLAIVDVKLPDYAYQISDLVSLDNKRHFGERFIPEFESRTRTILDSETTEEATGDWIDDELRSYGPDARLLVARAFRSYLEQEREQTPAKAAILAAQERIFFPGPANRS